MFFFFERPDVQVAANSELFRKLMRQQPDADIQELVSRHRSLMEPDATCETVSVESDTAPSGA